MSKEISIGNISNYYGGLFVKENNGLFYWSIECFDGHSWEEIDEKLYLSLLEHNEKIK